MFTHVRVAANDVATSRQFYDAVLGALGLGPAQDNFGMCMYSNGLDVFGFAKPHEGHATFANGLTIGFKAESEAAVDAFHAAGLSNGGTDEGEPSLRPNKMYAAYLRDPAGNKICAIKI